jgi:GNAT superfamily N-acetyltransferase
MELQLRQEPLTALVELGRVPTAFAVERVLEVEAGANGLGGFTLVEQAVATPWVKDYDALDGGPIRWAERFDLGRWGLIIARIGAECIGGTVIARDTPGLTMLNGRRDLAVVWDLRVAPAWRRTGVGTALFRAAETWAATHGCRQLQVETQNINVPACRFYARQGCTLGAVDRLAYPQLPGEVQLLWQKDLTNLTPSSCAP